MSDVFSKEKRSEVMSKIKGKDTEMEVKVRSYLFKQGYRFRKNDKRYPGKPDILLPKYKTAIFINGCFWHGHEECKYFKMPKSNIEFWRAKIERNRERDRTHKDELESRGFNVIVLWECELHLNFETAMGKLEEDIEKVHHE